MPGSGKTTVGQALAGAIGFKFVDLDEQIKKKTNLKIAELFEERGEGEFRTIESHVLFEQLNSPADAVLALGGGAILRRANRDAIKVGSKVIYLKVEIETLTQRLKAQTDERPLLTGDIDKKLKELFEERKHIYDLCASVVIDANDKSVDEIIKNILIEL